MGKGHIRLITVYVEGEKLIREKYYIRKEIQLFIHLKIKTQGIEEYIERDPRYGRKGRGHWKEGQRKGAPRA